MTIGTIDGGILKTDNKINITVTKPTTKEYTSIVIDGYELSLFPDAAPIPNTPRRFMTITTQTFKNNQKNQFQALLAVKKKEELVVHLIGLTSVGA
ncbi:Uncharacterised protein [Actinobacillus equuli]|nr:Uncharacterised protein [Actinobacillus equuli]